jgi:glycosyltransferase involved in cell wall biosynthesis
MHTKRQSWNGYGMLAAHLDLTPHLAFVKAQPQETLVQYYTAADVLVLPSHYESFGMVALEAMACGTPVVASQVGGLASTVVHERTGLLAPVGDWQAFARAISRVLASPTLRDMWGTLASNAPRRMPGRAWLSGMYNSIIASYGGSARRVVDSQPVASSQGLPAAP